jgi:hypothetical protein
MLLANNTFDLPFSKLSISMAVDLELVSQTGLEVQSDLTSNVCIRYELGPVELQVALKFRWTQLFQYRGFDFVKGMSTSLCTTPVFVQAELLLPRLNRRGEGLDAVALGRAE